MTWIVGKYLSKKITKHIFCVMCRYWHVPIHPSHQDYLGVHYVDPEIGVVYFVWVVLCLGLRDAAHIFTPLIAPLMLELRRKGYRGLI